MKSKYWLVENWIFTIAWVVMILINIVKGPEPDRGNEILRRSGIVGMIAMLACYWFGFVVGRFHGSQAVMTVTIEDNPARPCCDKEGCTNPANHRVHGSLCYDACDIHLDEITQLCETEMQPRFRTMDHATLAGIDRDWEEDFELENGVYESQCCRCQNMFTGHKRRVICRRCVHEVSTQLS